MVLIIIFLLNQLFIMNMLLLIKDSLHLKQQDLKKLEYIHILMLAATIIILFQMLKYQKYQRKH